jgi:hypothetical protein
MATHPRRKQSLLENTFLTASLHACLTEDENQAGDSTDSDITIQTSQVSSELPDNEMHPSLPGWQFVPKTPHYLEEFDVEDKTTWKT